MKINFQIETEEYGLYSGAIWIPDDQPVPSDEELELMKQQRVADWLSYIKSTQEIQPEQIISEEV